MAVTLNQFKYHLRFDEDSDEADIYLQSLLNYAISFVSRITERDAADAPPEFDLAVYMLATHWHETRSSAGEANLREYPHGFDMILTSLRKRFF